jgi:hypothetical protein
MGSKSRTIHSARRLGMIWQGISLDYDLERIVGFTARQEHLHPDMAQDD